VISVRRLHTEQIIQIRPVPAGVPSGSSDPGEWQCGQSSGMVIRHPPSWPSRCGVPFLGSALTHRPARRSGHLV